MPSINISILPNLPRSSACWPIRSHRVSAHLHTLAAMHLTGVVLVCRLSTGFFSFFSFPNHFSLSTVWLWLDGCRFHWTLINGFVVRYGFCLKRGQYASCVMDSLQSIHDGFDARFNQNNGKNLTAKMLFQQRNPRRADRYPNDLIPFHFTVSFSAYHLLPSPLHKEKMILRWRVHAT